MKKIVIYIAGSVQKPFLKENDKLMVDNEVKQQLLAKLSDFDVVLLDPNESKILGNRLARFGKDVLQVISSHFLVIDLRTSRGIGVGAEMMLAKFHQIPVISVCPENSNYKKYIEENGSKKLWIHPFVSGLSDVVVNDFAEAAQWIINFINNPSQVKSIKNVEKYIELYKDEYLENDKQFLEKYKKIKGSGF